MMGRSIDEPNHWQESIKVSARASHKLGLMITLILTGFVTLLIIYCHHQSKHTHSDQSIEAAVSSHLTDNLSKNLASIHSQSHLIHNAVSHSNQLPTTVTSSKVILMREHAPTQVYQSKNTVTNTANNPSRDSWAQGGSDLDFINHSDVFSKTQAATRLAHPEATVVAGELIPATLETAISSDLPGLVRAITQRPVYSYVGHRLLIPAGSRLIGQYNSMTLQGINRLCIVWQRLILPDGISVSIESPSTDQLGRSGQAASSVNSHFIERFQQGVLLSTLGASVATFGVDGSDQDNSSSQYRTQVASQLQQAAQQSVMSRAHIKPTLSVNQGSSIQIMVAKDLSFYSVMSDE